MTITAQVIADSISPDNIRLPSVQLRMPKFLLAQLNTHRSFSRSSSSSRAIPVHRLIESIKEDPVIPLSWGQNRPGMQPGEDLAEETVFELKAEWFGSMYDAISRAERMARLNAPKETINRILEPYAHSSTIVTSTEWANFFRLRLHGDAQKEMRVLAAAIQTALTNSKPKFLHHEEWHLPYIDEQDDAPLYIKKKVSAARCARVSYLTRDAKRPSVDEDLALYNRLITSLPEHASPCEMQATPDVSTKSGWQNPTEHRNFRGWRQLRGILGF